MSCATFVPHADPFMPMPSSKMKTWLRMALAMVVTTTTAIVKRTAEMPLKKPIAAQPIEPMNAPPMRGAQYSSASASTCGSSPNGCSRNGPGERQREEQRHERERRPQRVPQRARGVRAAPAAVGLRHEGLHREPHAAEQQDGAGHDPVDSAHRRHRVGGEPADEPQVGEIEQRLHGVGDHERRGEPEDLAQIDVRLAGRVDALRRQRSTAGAFMSRRRRRGRLAVLRASRRPCRASACRPAAATHSPAHIHAMPDERQMPATADRATAPPRPRRAAGRCR